MGSWYGVQEDDEEEAEAEESDKSKSEIHDDEEDEEDVRLCAWIWSWQFVVACSGRWWFCWGGWWLGLLLFGCGSDRVVVACRRTRTWRTDGLGATGRQPADRSIGSGLTSGLKRVRDGPV